jgi:microcystin degradation protein MlrC
MTTGHRQRVGIVALLQESNTFLAGKTTLDHFRADLLATGPAVREALAAAHHEVGGFFSGLAAAEIEAVPIFAARALPYGTMTADCLDSLLQMMTTALDAAGPLDGLLVAPHGATESEMSMATGLGSCSSDSERSRSSARSIRMRICRPRWWPPQTR